MALQKFRDRQKLIYWIVAIIVIPSFMVFGYSQVFDFNPENQSVGKIDEREYTYQEFSDFYQRIQNVNFGRPLYFTETGMNSSYSEQEGMFIALALRDKAIKHGLVVTDQEIATYINSQFGYDGGDEKELEGMIKNMLGNRTRMKSVYEYKIGVRDWLLIQKFLNLIDNSIFVPEALADLESTISNTTLSYGKLEVALTDFTKEATANIDALSESELKAKAQKFIDDFQKPQLRRLYPFLWTEAKWQLEYISVPLVVESLDPEVTEEDLAAFYKDNSNRYIDKDGKQQELAAVKEEVKIDYIAGYRAQTANNTLGNEYDRFLNRVVLTGDNSDNVIQKVTLEEISSDSRLRERGLTTGLTGATPLTAYEIADNPAFTGSGIQYLLASLDYQFQAAKLEDEFNKNNAASDKLFDDYSRSFRGFVIGNREMPLSSSEKIKSKVRLVKYIPGEARKIGDSDSEDLLASIKEAMIESEADKMTEEAAKVAIAELKENKRNIDGREVTTEESTITSLTGKEQELRTKAIGETVGPFLNEDASAYTVYILYGKEVTKNPEDQNPRIDPKAMSASLRGNSTYSLESPMPPIIKVGIRLASYLIVEKQNIKFYNK